MADSRKTDKSGGRLYAVRRSGIEGRGVFAVRPISRGTRIIEYTGERTTNEIAEERYRNASTGAGVTYFFIVDEETVIDGGSGGNAARLINHSCDPNCETLLDEGRVYIEAIRDIEPGEELAYDYRLQLDRRKQRDWRQVYACKCGARRCRGTMLEPTRSCPAGTHR